MESELEIRTSKTLQALLTQAQIATLSTIPTSEIPISGIALDSRQVKPGDIFFALSHNLTDGCGYIADAAQRGAAAAIGAYSPAEIKISIPYIQVEAPRAAMAWVSAAFYDFPARNLTVIGVTGTDGKTTTASLLYEILRAAGLRAGIISTVNAVVGNEVIDTGFHVTTPEAPDVQRYLANMLAAGLTHAVLETTSHGLAQDRVTACEFDIGVVTNVTHEHLDYHKSYAQYLSAKARLFEFLSTTLSKTQGNPRLAVLNRDDCSYEALNERIDTRRVAYSLSAGADYFAENIHYLPDGLHFKVRLPNGESLPIHSHLVGEYNVSNILAAIAAAISGLNISPELVAAGIMALQSVPGRMERIELGQNFTAIVDFAHTPNALLKTLQTARQITHGRVIAVFGSAGLRDREKRRLMAENSVQIADVSIFTAEDPRTESLNGILAEMADAATLKGGIEGQNLFRIPDRRSAIRKGVELARPDDIVLALGKGHEQSMCFGEIEYPWDDRIALKAALAEILHISGYSMPFLPDSGDS